MTAITHYLQVRADDGAWIDHMALWDCATDAQAHTRARKHRCQFPDRPHRIIGVHTWTPGHQEGRHGQPASTEGQEREAATLLAPRPRRGRQI